MRTNFSEHTGFAVSATHLGYVFGVACLLKCLGSLFKAWRSSDALPITDPTIEQMQFLNKNQYLAIKFLNSRMGEKEKYTLDDIDKAITLFREPPSPDVPAPDDVLEILGTCFGNFLVEELGLQWKIYDGIDAKTYFTMHEETSVLIFPFLSVYGALTGEQDHTLNELSETIKQII